MSATDQMLTTGEAALRIGVARKTIREYVRKGVLAGTRLGPKRIMIRESDLDGLVGGRCAATVDSEFIPIDHLSVLSGVPASRLRALAESGQLRTAIVASGRTLFHRARSLEAIQQLATSPPRTGALP